MQTVYTKKGEAVELESVDAREYIATGRWFAADPTVKAPKEEDSEKGKAE